MPFSPKIRISDSSFRIPVERSRSWPRESSTIFQETAPRYYGLIKTFKDATGIPLLMNTSFNLRGEPMVNTPEEAYSTFSRSGIDLLVLENWLIKK